MAVELRQAINYVYVPEIGKYGIPFGTLTKQVSQGKWLDERINIGSDTEQKSIEFSINNYICPDTKMGL